MSNKHFGGLVSETAMAGCNSQLLHSRESSRLQHPAPHSDPPPPIALPPPCRTPCPTLVNCPTKGVIGAMGAELCCQRVRLIDTTQQLTSVVQ